MSALARTQLDEVYAAITAADTPVDALVGALRTTFLALGAGDLSDPGGPKIDGRDFPLDAEQWKAICSALLTRGTELDPVGRVNLALDWMNLGPSGQEVVAA